MTKTFLKDDRPQLTLSKSNYYKESSIFRQKFKCLSEDVKTEAATRGVL